MNGSSHGNKSPPNSTSFHMNTHETTLPVAFLSTIFTFRVIWSVLGIIGNGLTIVAVAKFHSLESSTNYLVASLAVADLIQALLTPGVILHHVLVNQPSFVPICLVEKTFSAVGIRGNFINTLWIAIDRFLYIAYPLRYPLWLTKTKTFTLIGLTWCYLLIETPLLAYYQNVIEAGSICKISLIVTRVVYNRYIVPQCFVCIFVTLSCYIAIGTIAHKQSVAIAASRQPFETLESSVLKRQKKIAKMMFTVLTSYLISYIPAYAMSIIIQKSTTPFSLGMEKVTSLIYYTNTFINPMIYAWKSKDFKKVFKKMLDIKNDVSPLNINPEGAPQ